MSNKQDVRVLAGLFEESLYCCLLGQTGVVARVCGSGRSVVWAGQKLGSGWAEMMK